MSLNQGLKEPGLVGHVLCDGSISLSFDKRTLSLFREKNTASLSLSHTNRVSLASLVESAGESRSLNDRFAVFVGGVVDYLDSIDDSASLNLSSSNPLVFLEVATMGSASVLEDLV